MPADHDLISQPAKERYFVMPHARVLKLVLDAEFRHTEHVKRIRVITENIMANAEYGEFVACFLPFSFVSVNSFAVGVQTQLAEFCVLQAIEQFKNFDQNLAPSEPAPHYVLDVMNFCHVFLQDQAKLIVVERIVHRTQGKYRGRAKFSHAFKPKWRTVKETILHEIAC